MARLMAWKRKKQELPEIGAQLSGEKGPKGVLRGRGEFCDDVATLENVYSNLGTD